MRLIITDPNDYNGHLHYSDYFSYFDKARAGFQEQLGFSDEKLIAKGFRLIISQADCKYHRSVGQGDEVEVDVEMRPSGSSKASFLTRHTMRTLEGELVAVSECAQCFTDSSGKPVRPPAGFYERVAEHSQSIQAAG
jgi:YbgC/YbaW family acyl-CoA thioester hydrolase